MLRPRIQKKTRQDIECMRAAGRLVAETLVMAKRFAQPGVTTGEIDALIEENMLRHNATSLFKGYPGKVPFPAVACISVNEEVVHGIPGKRKLKEGDLLKIDTGFNLNGWCGDSAVTIPIGKITPENQRLLDVGEETLRIAIREMGRKKKWSHVARIMEEYVKSNGYFVVEQFVGHGIGRTMHEEPQVPNFETRSWRKQDFWLDDGLVIAVEPMVNMGTKEVHVIEDHWTVVTADRKPSVHVEHTLAVTNRGIEILTSREGLE